VQVGIKAAEKFGREERREPTEKYNITVIEKVAF